MRPGRDGLSDLFGVIIGSGFGLGLSPVFPGTCGAVAGVIIHLGTVYTLPVKAHVPVLVVFFILVCLANHILTPWAESYWQCHDPKHFVLDEVAGYLMVPIFFHGGELWKVVIWGFFLFRILDVFKLLPPARQIDRHMKGSWGILLDDLVSAAYAVMIMYVIKWAMPSLIV